MTVLQWLRRRRFDREHRPHWAPVAFPPVQLADGRFLDTGLMGVWCEKHRGWISACPNR